MPIISYFTFIDVVLVSYTKYRSSWYSSIKEGITAHTVIPSHICRCPVSGNDNAETQFSDGSTISASAAFFFTLSTPFLHADFEV